MYVYTLVRLSVYVLGCKQLAAVASRLGSAPGHSCKTFVTTCILLVDARLNIKTYITHPQLIITNKDLLSPITIVLVYL